MKAFVAFAFLLSGLPAFAQSNDQNFPTPVTSNEVSGVIPARPIGDPRLTTYYFVFNGNRGDVFLNIVTTNFKGEIDVYTERGLDPRTKITIYADNPERETGRVVYQRRPEKLILRIQGRSPNDDPATYQVKFAGSFAPITGAAAENTNEFPDILDDDSDAPVKVNAVGTIIEEEKPETPVAETEDQRVEDAPVEDPVAEVLEETPVAETVDDSVDEVAEEDAADPDEEDKVTEDRPSSPRVIITDPLADLEEKPREVTVDLTGEKKAEDLSAVVTVERVPEETAEPETAAEGIIESEEIAEEEDDVAAADDPETTDPPEDDGKVPTAAPAEEEDESAPAEEDEDSAPAEENPLARVFLKVEMKDGTRLERPMTEVTSVNVIEGVLTIVTIDGETRRIPILDVLKMTIEQ
ncbi:MAG: hypothetical protein DWQ47_02885 [Acidobacteria bacterium]|nr:MAG: hypothetical protein DWQ32_06435 [Acidobacteriota bacterium]REK01351.1 MAG: hypothetical protein DWQ38_02870 [Acidobacteriota bacterium]REK14307.1 MAG: hypothetical protein DWQ43_12125 [Acidobacteriota bacterium]REK45022.1 MAG: hypothetical protein DWQ47_02885 [Acidobacteriota bacterium]